jgi:hypothetical protein
MTSCGCTSVLAIPVPDHSALLLVNPIAVLEVAPASVQSLISAGG